MRRKKKECKLLQAFYDGQIGQEDIVRMKQHLDECPSCQHDIHVYNRMSDLVRITQDHEPSPAFFNQVWERVEQHIVRERLSLMEVAHQWVSVVWKTIEMSVKPAIAVSFILFLAVLPMIEKQNTTDTTIESQSEVTRVQSSGTVMVLQTQKSKMTIIWVVPQIVKQEGDNNAV